jgi:hypothetical protein
MKTTKKKKDLDLEKWEKSRFFIVNILIKIGNNLKIFSVFLIEFLRSDK